MTAYLDEYNPNSRHANYRVQSDSSRLKYRNIQSCIAVAIYPTASRKLVGVHLTTATTGNPKELQIACDELRQAIGNVSGSKAYLVANYRTHHAATRLKQSLKQFVAQVLVCNIGPVSTTNTGANADVKIELKANRPVCYVREHAPALFNQPKPKPDGGFKPGQATVKSDKSHREWQAVDFVPA